MRMPQGLPHVARFDGLKVSFVLEVERMRLMWITCGQRETAWYARYIFTLRHASALIASGLSAKHLI
jgi:hypothetical protein